MTFSASRRQRGISLVEVAIASVILGACGTLLLSMIDRQAKVASSDRSTTLVDRAHDAILAYAYLHHQLPCPARVTTGVENCDGSTAGYLPYLTLGLPEPAAGQLRYRMSLDLKSPTTSSPYRVVTSQRTGDFGDLQAQVVPLAKAVPGGHEALFDLCEALGSAAHSAKLAYEIGTDAAAPVPLGSSTTAAVSQVASEAVGRAQLATQLQCSTLAVAGRAHFNAALAATTMNRAMEDIFAQFVLAEHTYNTDLAQGLYFLANSVYSVDRANMKRLGAKAAFEASDGLDSRAVTVANVKTALAGAYTAALTVNATRFAINLVTYQVRKQTLKGMLDRTRLTAADISARATTASASAFFLEGKWANVPAP